MQIRSEGLILMKSDQSVWNVVGDQKEIQKCQELLENILTKKVCFLEFAMMDKNTLIKRNNLLIH
mgnify:CR=1 FL=1